MSFKEFLQRIRRDWHNWSLQLWPTSAPLIDEGESIRRRRGAIQQRMLTLRFAIHRLEIAVEKQELTCRQLEGAVEPEVSLPHHIEQVALQRERLVTLRDSLDRKENAYRRLQHRFHELAHS